MRVTGGFCGALVDLDLTELGVSVACVAKTRYKNPFQDRVYARVVLIGLLQSLRLYAQIQK
jgi:hypothetical protein